MPFKAWGPKANKPLQAGRWEEGAQLLSDLVVALQISAGDSFGFRAFFTAEDLE